MRRFTSVTCFVLFLSLGALFAPPVHAQTVEFTLPEAIDVVPGKLSVTFADSVDEDAAVAFVKERGFSVEAVNFYAVRLRAASDSALSEAQIAAWEADPRVLSVRVQPEDADALAERLGQTPPANAFTLVLDPALSRAEAHAVASVVPGVRILDVEKLPNDLVVGVGEDDEGALEVLEASPLVAYVTYLAY